VIHDTPNSQHESDDERLAEQASAAPSGNTENLDAAERDVPTAPAPEPVHRWLDGEKVSPAELDAPDAEKHVKFWAKVNAETARRRRLQTPSGLDAIIMDKLKPPVVKDD
jgi:hypothetical protein